MSALYLLLVVALSLPVQIDGPTAPLTLDIRVFRGPTEVTRETTVAIYRAGERTGGRRVAIHDSGAHRVALRTGAYDVQLLQAPDGKVTGIAWSTLRLVADYPDQGQPQLEVLNFDKAYGAVQVRGAGTGWSARLLRKDGSEVARGLSGDGYQLLVAPAGTYDIAIAGPRPGRIHDVEVKANLTAVKTF